MYVLRLVFLVVVVLHGTLTSAGAQGGPLNVSGVYPHLRMWNQEGECGTGAVVVWQGDLWVITYAPHMPGGSSDKLYRITSDLDQRIFAGSVGGTAANRMLHRETDQLLIGPYLIDSNQKIRVIPPAKMFGRLTGNARHLSEPADKVYYATMEEGLYEVDLRSLQVTCRIRDGNAGAPKAGVVSRLPGYHGKGLFSGQDRLVYANNGQRGAQVDVDPTVPSGALAQWFGEGDWELVRRNQFTEVSGPGGIEGNANPATDPIWAMGWDARSVMLALLEAGEWHFYRLPKGSHSYDGAHGWNTEWPRIREIGETDLLATMHGTFWRFPVGFSRGNSAGIAPRSNYLKVVGDFCRWNDRIVLGCDDSAKAEFLNTRSFKAQQGAPLQSNSNLWFVEPARIDRLGPAIGRGSVWLRDDVQAGETSDPFLFSGYDYRQLHLTHQAEVPVTFVLELDRRGSDQWETLSEITVPARGAVSYCFQPDQIGAWIRLKAVDDATTVTANFQYRNRDLRTADNGSIFDGITLAGAEPASTGRMRSLAHDRLGLVASSGTDAPRLRYYEINSQLEFVPVDDPGAVRELVQAVRQPDRSYMVNDSSVLLIEDGKRYLLPKGDRSYDEGSARIDAIAPFENRPHVESADAFPGFGPARVCREVATERDLLNVHGTFYELPARNAQGLAKVRPIATHNLAVQDFCSHNGLLFFTGIDADTENDHVFRSVDGKAAVWAGVIDDLWQLGKPRGRGGPWKDKDVEPGEASDPYLMTAYDRKRVELTSTKPVVLKLEVDVDGTGIWVPYRSFSLEAHRTLSHTFPEGFSAYWVRAVSEQATSATVIFFYE